MLQNNPKPFIPQNIEEESLLNALLEKNFAPVLSFLQNPNTDQKVKATFLFNMDPVTHQALATLINPAIKESDNPLHEIVNSVLKSNNDWVKMPLF